MKEWRHEETHGVHLNRAVILSKEWGPPLICSNKSIREKQNVYSV